MNNALFLHDNEVDRAVITASSEVATMPVANVQDPQRTVMWRSAAGGAVSIDITLQPDEEQVQAFALVDLNLSIGGTVLIEAWSDALGGASLVYSQTLQPYQPTYPFGEGNFGDGLFGGYDIYINGLSIADARAVLRPIMVTMVTPGQSALYWRVTLTDPSLTFFELGRIYLGPSWAPKVNFSFRSTKSRKRRARRRESRGGQYYSNPRTDRTVLTFSLDWLDDADRDRLWIMHMILGEVTPFIIVLRPNGGYEQESSTYYGVFNPIRQEQLFDNNAATPITIEEVL